MPLINSHGEALFMQVMKCVGGEASRSYIDYFTDIVLALNKKYFDNLCRYIICPNRSQEQNKWNVIKGT